MYLRTNEKLHLVTQTFYYNQVIIVGINKVVQVSILGLHQKCQNAFTP